MVASGRGCEGKREVHIVSIDPEQAAARMRLAQLRQHHDDLKLAIDAMIAQGCNPLAVQRTKKRKLELKDEIARRSAALLPDISA